MRSSPDEYQKGGQETMAEARARNKNVAANCRKRVIALVQSLPEARAVPAGDRHLSLEVRGKRFGWFLDDHHRDGRLALNLKSAGETSQTLVRTEPERFHVPKYIGHHGWLGVWLDSRPTNWDEIEKLITDAYHLSAQWNEREPGGRTFDRLAEHLAKS